METLREDSCTRNTKALPGIGKGLKHEGPSQEFGRGLGLNRRCAYTLRLPNAEMPLLRSRAMVRRLRRSCAATKDIDIRV
jgi:hypothetical protein